MTLLEGRFAPVDDLEEVQSAYAILFDHLAVSDAIEPSDVIMCFGSRDPMVPVRAASLHAGGAARIVVTTGGVPHLDGRPEAAVLAEHLVNLGVPPEAVIAEPHSTHTGENVVLGMRALMRAHPGVSRVIAVAWPFASRRCVATFASHHPEIAVSSAPAFDEPGRHTPLRPATARWAVEQFDRLVDYRIQGWISDREAPAEVAAAAEVLRRALP